MRSRVKNTFQLVWGENRDIELGRTTDGTSRLAHLNTSCGLSGFRRAPYTLKTLM